MNHQHPPHFEDFVERPEDGIHWGLFGEILESGAELLVGFGLSGLELAPPLGGLGVADGELFAVRGVTLSDRARPDQAQFGASGVEGDLEVVPGLEVEPELRRRAEELGETEGSVGGDAAAALDDFGDALGRDAEFAGEGVAAKVEGLHKVLEEVFARVDVGAAVWASFLL